MEKSPLSDLAVEWFRDIIQHHVYDIVQLGPYCNDGLTRTLRVAQMAAQAGMEAAPQNPKADPLEAPFLLLSSVILNLEGFSGVPRPPRQIRVVVRPPHPHPLRPPHRSFRPRPGHCF